MELHTEVLKTQVPHYRNITVYSKDLQNSQYTLPRPIDYKGV